MMPVHAIGVVLVLKEGTAMTNNNTDNDLLDLAREIAETGRTTTDPETGRRLTELARRLLEAAGLPRDDGGGGLPSDQGSSPADWPAWA